LFNTTFAGNNLAIRIAFQSPITLNINQTTPGEVEVLYLKYDYLQQTNSFADILSNSYSSYYTSPPTNAIRLGEITYSGSNITGININRRDYGSHLSDQEYQIVDPTNFLYSYYNFN
jgi:hypothetical protein